jgi:two-component system, LytTR family, sensor kinase
VAALSKDFQLRRLWLLIAAASLVPASLSIITSYINARVVGRIPDWRIVVFASSLWITFGALSPVIYFFAHHFPLRRDAVARTLTAHLAGALILCLAWTSLGVLIAVFLIRNPQREPFLRYYASWILTNLPWSVFLYFAVLGSIFAFSYYREAREREAQQARLAAQLAEAKLGALRMQLNPHFLFNSLNAITVLVRDQNTIDAARMLELLSGILRQVLKSDNRKEVTLDRELQFTERYLAIEQVRFSDRLQLRWSIDPAAREALVPEFILQPLVENAVRHGIAKRAESGLIEVMAARSDGNLVLSVHDNGPGYYPKSDSGVGLANTRARLETLFGEAASVEARNADEGGAMVTVSFPLRPLSDG